MVEHTHWDAKAHTITNTSRNTFDNTPSHPTVHAQGHPKSHAHSNVEDGIQSRGIPEPLAYLDDARGRRSSSKETFCSSS